MTHAAPFPDAALVGEEDALLVATSPVVADPDRRDRDGTELTRRTTGSAAWSIAARLVTKGIDFVTLLVLAQLLAPADFGVIAIAMTLVTIVEAVFELPIYQVLVNLDVVEDRHIDTAFTLSALRGLAIAAVLLAAALPFARLYGDPRLAALIAVLGLAPAMRGLGSPRMAIFAKRLDYRRELTGEVLSKASSFLLASAAAWWLRDYRALMVGILATPATWILVSYALAPYRPRLALAGWPLFSHFMGWTTASQLMSAFNWQCDRLILGRFIGRAELGVYALANDMAFIPEQALIKPIVRPLMSAFALIRDDRERLAAAYLKTSNTVLALGTPVLLALALLPDPAVRFALGGKWIAAAPILGWLALTLIPPLFTSPLPALAMAMGRPRMVLRQTAGEALTRLPAVFLGAMLMRTDGVIIARGAGSIMSALIALWGVRALIGTSIVRQLGASWRTAVGAAALAAIILPLRPLLDVGSRPLLGVLLAGVAGLGLLAYVATLWALWRLSGRPAGLEQTVVNRATALLGRFGGTRG